MFVNLQKRKLKLNIFCYLLTFFNCIQNYTDHLIQRLLNWGKFTSGGKSLVIGGKFYPNKYLNKCYRIRILIKFRFGSLSFIKISLKLRKY